METCGSAARNVCSAAGKLMFIRRRKKICGPVEKKVAAVGKFVRLREHCSAAGKRSRLWESLFGCGSIVQPPEKGRGCGKICSAAGKRSRLWKGLFSRGSIVQPPENLFSRRSDRSPGTSLQLYLQKQPKRSNAKRKKKKIK